MPFSGLGPLYVLHHRAGVSSVWCLNGCVSDWESDECETALVTDDTSSQSSTHHYGISPQGQWIRGSCCSVLQCVSAACS